LQAACQGTTADVIRYGGRGRTGRTNEVSRHEEYASRLTATAILIVVPALASAQSATQTTSQPAASGKTSGASKAETSASTQPRDAKGRFMKKDRSAASEVSPKAANAKASANAQRASAKQNSTQLRDAKGRFMSKDKAAATGVAGAKAATTGQGNSASQASNASEAKHGRNGRKIRFLPPHHQACCARPQRKSINRLS